jgi:thiol:disulfide interchange protein DsbD
MIPITVSFFLKQSEKEHHQPMTMALVYSGTIVVVLTLAAAFLLSVFRWLSVNPFMNYGLGLLFVYFALSLFGMYDIELPGGLARYTSSHEGQGGLAGTMFMALTFTIISFACVAPFLGGFGGTAAGIERPWWHNLAGGLAFAITFAAPFFLLALFPTMLRRLPRSGSWLNSVKVVMGFLELAAAIKFFRSAELVLTNSETWLFTFDFALGIYVALAFLCGLYLLGVYRLPHDTPEEHLGVMRMLFAMLFLAIGLYMLPALFKDASGDNQRPRGTLYAWIDSFLLPEAKPGEESGNLPATVAQARAAGEKDGKPQRIFVDFTGVSCQNCNLNENYVFSKPRIRELFRPYLIVKLYTDTVPTQYFGAAVKSKLRGDGEAYATSNRNFQQKVFGTLQLPLYVVLEPQADGTIKVIGVYPEGRINKEEAFAEFLRDPG